MGEVLASLKDVSDVVLIDAPPILGLADALTMSPFADAIVLVVDAERTRRGAVEHARQQLDEVDAYLLGTVLNNFDASKTRSQPYYGYGYDYHYGVPQEQVAPRLTELPAEERR